MLFLHYFKKALTGLIKSRGFTLTIVATLGVATATFLVVVAIAGAVFFTPLSFDNEERIYLVNQVTALDTYTVEGQQSQNTISYWHRNQSSFEYFSPIFTHEVYLEDAHRQPLLLANFVASDYFEIFDVPIVKGRSFNEHDDDLDSASSNILINESVWQEYFGGREDVTEEMVTILGVPRRIIGVVEDSFAPPKVFGGDDVSIWLPSFDERDSAWSTLEESHRAVGQLKLTISPEQSQRNLESLMAEVESQWKADWPQVQSISAKLIPIREVELGNMRVLSSFLLIGTFGLLVIAATNVSNLFFTRTIEKSSTAALQIIIGAKRKDLMTEKLTESSLLCFFAVMLGAFLAWIIVSLLPAFMPKDIPMLHEFSVDGLVLICALVTGAALAILFAITSLHTIDFKNLTSYVQGSGKGVPKRIAGKKMGAFIAAQVMIASVVLLGGSFFLAKAWETKTHDLGLNVKGFYHFHAFAGTGQVDSGRQRFLEDAIKNELLKKQAIQNVSIALVSPFRETRYTREITRMNDQSIGNFQANFIDDDYLATAGIRIVEGRNFNNLSFEIGQREVIVSESLAAQLGDNALGQSIRAHGGTEYVVVGVVEDGFHPLHYHQDRGARIYFTKIELGFPIAIRSNEALDRSEISQWLGEIDSELFIFEFHDISENVYNMLFLDGLLIFLISGLMFITLLLSVVGIFGMLSYVMKMREYDIGIRIAVGAKSKHVYLTVAKLVAAPVVLGLVLAFTFTAFTFSSLPESYDKHIVLSPVLSIGLLSVVIVCCLAATLWPVQKLLNNNPQNNLKGN